jgi:hypothetical protein
LLHARFDEVGGLEEDGREDAGAQAGKEVDCSIISISSPAPLRQLQLRRVRRTLKTLNHIQEDDEREVEPFDISALSMLRNATVSGRNERLAWC